MRTQETQIRIPDLVARKTRGPKIAMPAPGEFGVEEDVHQVFRCSLVQVLRANRQNVGIIVFARQPHFIIGNCRSGAHARYFVGCHSHSNACRADQNSAIGAAATNLASNRLRVIGIIARLSRFCSKINQFMSLSGQRLAKFFLESKPGVIGANGNFHNGRTKFYHARIGFPVEPYAVE